MPDATSEQRVQEELERQRAEYQQRAIVESVENAPHQAPEPAGLVFYLCAFLLALIGDAAELFTAGTFGWFVGLAVDGVLLILFHSLQGAKQQIRRVLAIVGLETIPFLNVLPLRALGIVWLYLQSRSSTAQHVARITHV